MKIKFRKMSNSVLQKRKRSVVTLDTKMKIIGEVKKGSSQKFVADKYGVAKSTVSDIWKDREKIENLMSSVDSVCNVIRADILC